MNDPKPATDKKPLFSSHFLSNLLLVVLGIAFYFLLSNLRGLLDFCNMIIATISPFIVAFVMAYLLNPVVFFFEGHVFTKGSLRLRRGLAIGISYLLAMIAIALLLYFITPQIYDSLVMLVNKVPSYLKGLRSVVNDLAANFSILDTENASFIIDSYSDFISSIASWLQSTLPKLLNVSISIGSGIVNTLMSLIASIYILADKERLKRSFKRLLFAVIPSPHDSRLLDILRRSNRIFSQFIDGKLLDSLIIGVLCLIGTLILKIPFAGLISLIVGITNIIPFFGPFIGAVPSLLILLIVNPWSALWFLIFIVALQQLDGNVIGPRILGDSTGVSALGVLIAITVGGKFWGVTGMLIGVPLYAILGFLFREFLDLRMKRKVATAEADGKNLPAEMVDILQTNTESNPASAPKSGKMQRGFASVIEKLFRKKDAPVTKQTAAPSATDTSFPQDEKEKADSAVVDKTADNSPEAPVDSSKREGSD